LNVLWQHRGIIGVLSMPLFCAVCSFRGVALCCAAAATCRHYRKVVVSSMPQLNYLDDAPVAENDRRLAAAFMQVWTG
jgi:hypothetical protein